ncbi:MAG: hypothetical protein LBF65_02120 [Holosporales bacterium]|jgi:hypothetical protein|nr:hypothetical protein [Holosporales bacterium]
MSKRSVRGRFGLGIALFGIWNGIPVIKGAEDEPPAVNESESLASRTYLVPKDNGTRNLLLQAGLDPDLPFRKVDYEAGMARLAPPLFDIVTLLFEDKFDLVIMPE